MSLEGKINSILEEPANTFAEHADKISTHLDKDPEGLPIRQKHLDLMRENIEAWNKAEGVIFWEPPSIEASNTPYVQKLSLEDILIANMFYSPILSKIEGVEEKRRYISETIERIKKTTERFSSKCTFGIEIELIQGTKGNITDIDVLQNLGFPVFYDGFREIAVPPSKGILPQLYFVKLIRNITEGSKDYSFNVHMNVGGLDFDENILILDLMMQSANFTNVDYRNMSKIPGYRNRGRHSKLLHESEPEDTNNPRGHAFKVRENGVIEFRAISFPKDYTSFSEYLNVFSSMSECVRAYQSRNNGESLNSDESTLAEIWEKVRETLQHIITITSADRIGSDFNAYMREMIENPQHYFNLMAELLLRSARQFRPDPYTRHKEGPSLYSTKSSLREYSKRVNNILDGKNQSGIVE